jgi:hypothetical protein
MKTASSPLVFMKNKYPEIIKKMGTATLDTP